MPFAPQLGPTLSTKSLLPKLSTKTTTCMWSETINILFSICGWHLENMAGRRLILVVLLWLKIGALHVLDRFPSKSAWSIARRAQQCFLMLFPEVNDVGHAIRTWFLRGNFIFRHYYREKHRQRRLWQQFQPIMTVFGCSKARLASHCSL